MRPTPARHAAGPNTAARAKDRWAGLRYPELLAHGVRPGGVPVQAMQQLLASWKKPSST